PLTDDERQRLAREVLIAHMDRAAPNVLATQSAHKRLDGPNPERVEDVVAGWGRRPDRERALITGMREMLRKDRLNVSMIVLALCELEPEERVRRERYVYEAWFGDDSDDRTGGDT